MKYPLTKSRFRLQFLGLVGKIYIVYNKQNNEKYPNEDQQRLPQSLGCGLGGFVRRWNYCKYLQSFLDENMEKSKNSS